MIVPEYWAEGRRRERLPDRQLTVRRFGWSDISQEDAQRHADERTTEAFERIARGEKLPRREPKVRYNGADGVPIREEIAERFRDAVVTRNSYGARCLNTPDVLFADLDCPEPGSTTLPGCAAYAAGIAGAIWLASTGVVTYLGGVGLVVILAIVITILERTLLTQTRWQARAMQRLRAFVAKNSEWHLRVYRSPNGLRLLAMHKTFDPRSEEVDSAFRAFGVDPVYRTMCQKQNCFRARLSAKPWRIGIKQRLKPRPGVIPIIAGRTAPPGKRMGHAGAIISGGKGTAAEKTAALEASGIPVARIPSEVAGLVAEALGRS